MCERAKKHATSCLPAKTVGFGGLVITPSSVSRDSGERMELRADLHLHTREGERFIAYDARELVDRAAHSGFQVLSITNHNTVTFSAHLQGYAQERGILLIPGIEATIEGKHVLLYSIDVSPERIRTFADLRRLRRPEWLVVAPHPFFPGDWKSTRLNSSHSQISDAVFRLEKK